MTLSDSELSYTDCYEALDRAMEAARGIRIGFHDFASANYFRMRCHQARKVRRKKNQLIYPEMDHPLHGRSEYDILRLTFYEANDMTYVYFQKNEGIPGIVEDLDDVAPKVIEHQPQLRLPAPHDDIAPEVEPVRRRF